MTPKVDCTQHHAGLVVTDIVEAVGFYTTKLGFTSGFVWGDPPTFAGVRLDQVEVFLQRGTPPPDGAFVYFMVGDADELFALHLQNGVQIATPPGDRDYGIRDYTVRDPYGHRLTFGHPIFNAGDKVAIERVDVPVRLEKRIVAVLHDLAAHKRMSLSSLLEETLMHTFEPFGDGVASPHTTSQLRHIQTLKQKHGIDYDVHATYRFVERETP
jgi:catechol 2,3-dioxygenase-like lactoylglutathione lyase family enzyme